MTLRAYVEFPLPADCIVEKIDDPPVERLLIIFNFAQRAELSKALKLSANQVQNGSRHPKGKIEHEAELRIDFSMRKAWAVCSCGWVTMREDFVSSSEFDVRNPLHVITWELGQEIGRHEQTPSS